MNFCPKAWNSVQVQSSVQDRVARWLLKRTLAWLSLLLKSCMTCCSELPIVGFAGTLTVCSHPGEHPKLSQSALFLAVALKYHEKDHWDHLAFQPPHCTQGCYYLETTPGGGLSEPRTSSVFRVQSRSWSSYTLQPSFVNGNGNVCFSEILGGWHEPGTMGMPAATWIITNNLC